MDREVNSSEPPELPELVLIARMLFVGVMAWLLSGPR